MDNMERKIFEPVFFFVVKKQQAMNQNTFKRYYYLQELADTDCPQTICSTYESIIIAEDFPRIKHCSATTV